MTPPQTRKEMTELARKITEKSEFNRLKKILENMPPNRYTVAEGLIREAARMRVLLDQTYADIEKNGRVEMFSQSEKAEPYERERPVVRQYMQANKNYQSIIKQLIDICPERAAGGKLEALLKE